MPRQPLLSEISRRRKLRLLLRHLPAGSHVLEIGAGSGWFAGRLRDRGCRVTTLDLLPPADVIGDVNAWRDFGLPAASFDAVVALEVIEHVDCLEALQDLCVPGGMIMLSSPHPDWDWVLKLLEGLRMTQRRTSPHDFLTRFDRIPLRPVVSTRPAFVHQVAIFRNAGR